MLPGLAVTRGGALSPGMRRFRRIIMDSDRPRFRPARFRALRLRRGWQAPARRRRASAPDRLRFRRQSAFFSAAWVWRERVLEP